MKHIFIVNPVSGRSDASQVLVPRIIQAAQAAGVDYQIELTRAPHHATQLARQYAWQDGESRIYACGGDGTLNEVLAGAWDSPRAQVGCVPCGSGNDFVRNFSDPEAFLDIDAQLRGDSAAIDLVRTDRGVAAAICSAGLDAQVAYGIPKFRRLPLCGGQMAYNLSIVQQVCGRLGRRLRIVADGREYTGEYLMAAVCNGVSYGGGFRAVPLARMDDGLLDLVLVKKVSRLRIARVVGMYKAGEHFQNGRIRPELADVISFTRAKQAEIHSMDGQPVIINVDGECQPALKLETAVLPAAGRAALPQGVTLSAGCSVQG